MFHQAQATDYIDLLVQLEALAANSHVDAIVLNVGGTGWAVGDLFDINGGTIVGGLNATGEVLTEAAGVVTSVRIFSGGAYTVSPGVAATTAAIVPATGINLTIDATIIATGWAVNRSQILVAPERELLLQGSGGGADEIYLGFETKRDGGSGTFYWELGGFTGFDNGQAFDNQPGSSRLIGTTLDCTTPLNNGIIDYWFVIDSYSITGIFKSGSSYTNLFAGFLNQFTTPAEFPYPIAIIGCSAAPLRNVPFNNSSQGLSGLVMPTAFTSSGNGPGADRWIDGQWYRLRSNYLQSSGKIANTAEAVIWPGVSIPLNLFGGVVDEFMFDAPNYDPDSYFGGQLQSTPLYLLNPTPDSGGDIQFLWPTVIYRRAPSIAFIGELPDIFPISTQGLGAVSEDTVTDSNGDVYILFQNCNRTDSWAFFAIKRTF